MRRARRSNRGAANPSSSDRYGGTPHEEIPPAKGAGRRLRGANWGGPAPKPPPPDLDRALRSGLPDRSTSAPRSPRDPLRRDLREPPRPVLPRHAFRFHGPVRDRTGGPRANVPRIRRRCSTFRGSRTGPSLLAIDQRYALPVAQGSRACESGFLARTARLLATSPPPRTIRRALQHGPRLREAGFGC